MQRPASCVLFLLGALLLLLPLPLLPLLLLLLLQVACRSAVMCRLDVRHGRTLRGLRIPRDLTRCYF